MEEKSVAGKIAATTEKLQPREDCRAKSFQEYEGALEGVN